MEKSRYPMFSAAMFGIALLMAAARPAQAQFKVLVFHGFFGYQHSALTTATAAIRNTLPTLMGPTKAFTADETTNPTDLTPTNLAQYQVLILNNNTGIGGLTTAQRATVMNFAQTKGVVAFHSTADFKGGASWPEMVSYIGGALDGHTAAMGKLRTETAAASHPINEGLSATAMMNDEWYGYSSNPRSAAGTTILTNIDESSLQWDAGSMGDHPISWCKEMAGGGRMFYTAMGHRDSIMERNAYARRQLYNGILWAAKATPTKIAAEPPAPGGGVRMAGEKGALRVTFPEAGEHLFSVSGVDGRRVLARRGSGARSYDLPGLRSGAVYLVSGRTPAGAFSRMIAIP